MEDKEHESIQIVYVDGTIETLENGCAIKINQGNEEEGLQVKILFPNGTSSEEAEMVLAVLNGLYDR